MAIISRSEQSYDNLPLNPKYDVRFRIPYLFERSEFLIATSKTKKSVRVCGCSANLGFSVENTNLGFSVWYQRAPGTTEKKKNAWYQRALRCQLRGRPFHPSAGRLRFSGAATLTQSSSFSCGAGLQSESRLLLCCAPAVYMLAADAPYTYECKAKYP